MPALKAKARKNSSTTRCRKLPIFGRWKARPGEEGAAGDVDCGFSQRLVHRQQAVAERRMPLVAQRLAQRLPARYRHPPTVWWSSMCKSPFGRDRQVQQGMAGEGGQHVVEESDSGLDLRHAGTIQRERQADIRLRGGARQRGVAACRLFPSWLSCPSMGACIRPHAPPLARGMRRRLATHRA
jgi:hypothetical protein